MTDRAVPRYLARAGTYAEFERHGRFADPSRPFMFAIPGVAMVEADRASALARSGWSRSAIEARVGQDIVIVIVIVDTHVPVLDRLGQPRRMTVSRMDPSALLRSASSDPDFLSIALARGIDFHEVADLMAIAAGGRSGNPDLDARVDALRTAMDRYYGFADLAAERMVVEANGTGFRLTSDNYKMFILGRLTPEDVDGAGEVSQREVVDRFMLDTSAPTHVGIRQVQLDSYKHVATAELWLRRANLRWVADTLRGCLTRSLPRKTSLETASELMTLYESGPQWDPIVNLTSLSTARPALHHLSMSVAMAGELADALAALSPIEGDAVVGGARQKWSCSMAEQSTSIRADGEILEIALWSRNEDGVDLATSVSFERASLDWLLDSLRAQVVGSGRVRRGAGADRLEVSAYGPVNLIALFNHRAPPASHPGRHMLVTSRRGIEVIAGALADRG